VSPTNRIYHYCKLDTAIESILPLNELLLNNFNKTNDPREYKSFLFAEKYWKKEHLLDSDMEIANQKISEILRSDCKFISFSQDFKDFFGYEYARMWSYYGANHKGICLEIDKNEFISENSGKIDPLLFRKIQYKEFKINKPYKTIFVDHTKLFKLGEAYLKNDFRKRYFKELFFIKDIEWASEHEFRLLFYSKKFHEKEYCSIKKSLKKIFFGVDFNMNYLPSVKNICPNIDLYSLKYEGLRLNPYKI